MNQSIRCFYKIILLLLYNEENKEGNSWREDLVPDTKQSYPKTSAYS